MVRRQKKVETGDRFGYLVVMGEIDPDFYINKGNTMKVRRFRFRCICRKIYDATLNNVAQGRIVSCGCKLK